MLKKDERQAIQRCLLDMSYDPQSPIEQIRYDCSGFEQCLSIAMGNDVDLYEAIAGFSGEICDAVGRRQATIVFDEPSAVKKVFTNGPVVGVIWSDGKKTMTRCHEDDKFSLNFGLMNNYLRKVTNNRGKYDMKWDDAACSAVAIAEMLGTPGEMRDAAKMLEFLADANEILEGAE